MEGMALSMGGELTLVLPWLMAGGGGGGVGSMGGGRVKQGLVTPDGLLQYYFARFQRQRSKQ